MSGVGGTFGSAIDELRNVADSILAALDLQNKHLATIAKPDIPTAKPPLIPISESQIRATEFIANVFTPIATVPQGIYYQLVHWVVEHWAEEGSPRLYIGPHGAKTVTELTPLDTAGVTAKGKYVKGALPDKVILPPNTTLYVISDKEGRITTVSINYQLSL